FVTHVLSACCCVRLLVFSCFFFTDTAPTEFYTLSLHDALPISQRVSQRGSRLPPTTVPGSRACRCNHGSLCLTGHPRGPGAKGPHRAWRSRRSIHAGSDGALRRRALRRVLRTRTDSHLRRPAPAGAGLHPAYSRRAVDSDSPVVAREVLAGTGRGARRTGACE